MRWNRFPNLRCGYLPRMHRRFRSDLQLVEEYVVWPLLPLPHQYPQTPILLYTQSPNINNNNNNKINININIIID